MRMSSLQLFALGRLNRRNKMPRERSQTQKSVLCDAINIKFKTRQNEAMIFTSEERLPLDREWKGSRGRFPGCSVLFHELGAGHVGVFHQHLCCKQFSEWM